MTKPVNAQETRTALRIYRRLAAYASHHGATVEEAVARLVDERALIDRLKTFVSYRRDLLDTAADEARLRGEYDLADYRDFKMGAWYIVREVLQKLRELEQEAAQQAQASNPGDGDAER